MKKIALFGGTAQGRELALALQRAGMEVWVSVATGLGRDLQEEAAGSALRVRTGRMDAGEMEKFLREGHFFAQNHRLGKTEKEFFL